MLLIALAWSPSRVAAQDGEVLTINLSGAAGASVMAATPNGRQVLGRATSGTGFALNMSALNAGKGDRVEVRVDRTGSEPVIVLVPPGVADTGCAAADDDCEVIATVPWGTSRTIGVNVGSGMPPLSRTAPPKRFRIGVDYTSSSFGSLKDVACDMMAIAGLTGCTVDDKGTGIGVFAEYTALPGIDLGIRYSTTDYQVDQAFGSDMIDHRVNVNMYDAYARYRPLPAARINPFVFLGGSWICNESDLVSLGEVFDTRSEGGFRFLGGAGADVQLTDRFGLRLGTSRVTGGGGDADSHWRVSAATTFTF
jgi:hypothetical protein